MVPVFIVDGHNLILTTSELADTLHFDGKRASRDEAEELIHNWAEREGAVEVCLYYDGQNFPDGHPGNRDAGPLRVRFTDPPAEADDRIVFEATREAGSGRAVTVVTGDGGIVNRLSSAKVKIMAAGEFLARVRSEGPAPSKEERLSSEDQQRVASEMIARGISSGGKQSITVGGDRTGNAVAAAAPSVIPPRTKDEKREAFLKRQEKKKDGPRGFKKKSRRKKRGF